MAANSLPSFVQALTSEGDPWFGRCGGQIEQETTLELLSLLDLKNTTCSQRVTAALIPARPACVMMSAGFMETGPALLHSAR